jgi:diguanylate cyclase (GGDEF)-like protein
VGDLALIAGVATVLLRRVAPASRRPLQIIVAGLLIYIVTDLSYTFLGLQHGTVGSRWLDVCWMIADGLFALSAIDQHHQASRQGRSDSPGSVGAPTSRLPYLAVAVAYGLLLTMAGGQDLYSIGGMIVGAVLVTATVLLRQMSALHENRRLATIDSLTGIANRALVQQRLDAALALAGRRERRVAALVIDLDRFKSVNDTLGHDAGDALLATVASRLSSVLRASELAGRLGGDEFAVIVTDLPDDTAAQAVADRILMALHPPIEFGPHLLTAPASIGVAVCGADLKNGDELLRRADIAMYAAKRDGGRRYRVYTPALETGSLMPDLLRAIHDGELTLHYQPIFDLEADRLAGFEALVRWPHPERGLLGSAEFVPLAEETGMIVPMGAWVLREACAQMRRWEQRSPHAGCLMLNVNVSALQVRSPDALGEIGEIVRQNGYDPRRLVLELTEGALPHDDAPALAQIEGLRQMGIRIAIDDFGTGYSTLSRLRRLPVDILKIDRSFVTDIEESEDGRTMAAAMVNLGQALKLSVVAEGIETAGQLRALREMRCGYGQGFYFARPLVPELAAQLIDQPLAPASVVSIGRR